MQRVLFLFNLFSHLLVLIGFIALSLTGMINPFFILILCLLTILSFILHENNKYLLSKKASSYLTTIYLPILLIDLFFLSTYLTAIMHLLIFLQLNKLLSYKEDKDFLHMHIISFLYLLFVSLQVVAIEYAAIFFTYLIIGIFTFIIFHFKQELQKNKITTSLPIFNLSFFGIISFITSTVFILTILLFLIIPRLHQQLISGSLLDRDRKKVILSGLTEIISLGEIGTIVENNERVMRVEIKNPEALTPHSAMLFRATAFDYYDGIRWYKTEPDDLLRGVTAGKYILRKTTDNLFSIRDGVKPAHEQLVIQNIYLENLTPKILPILSKPFLIDIPLPVLLKDRNDGVYLPYPHLGKVNYKAYSVVSNHNLPIFKERNPRYDSEIVTLYTQLPKKYDEVRKLTQAITKSANNVYDKVKAVENYLKNNYKYSWTLPVVDKQRVIEDFLFKAKFGNCEYFATSMVIMLRTIGIPARLVTGFRGGTWNEYGNFYEIRQSDAHTWVEVYFNNYGFLEFDPTPPLPPEPFSFIGHTLSKWHRYFLFLEMKWYKHVINYDMVTQLGLIFTIRDKLTNLTTNIDILRILNILLLSIIIAAVVLLLINAYKKRPITIKRSDSRLTNLCLMLLKVLAKNGIKKDKSLTLKEFSNQIYSNNERIAQYLYSFIEIYYPIRFGGKKLTYADETKLIEIIKNLKVEIITKLEEK